jgi:predicted nuclease of restriction endonuclease-like RecB superfamily
VVLRLKKVTLTFKPRSAGYRLGFRSGLEEKIADQLEAAGLPVIFETVRFTYRIPARDHKYTPDFQLPKKGGVFYIESKGLWNTIDRAKILYSIKQNPSFDLRMVFSNQNTKLYKGSKTTYKDYCIKHSIRYAHKWIPDEWLREAQEAFEELDRGT